MFSVELAKDELQQRGYRVLGGYMSPVNDAYKKKVYCDLAKSIWNYVSAVLVIEFRS